MFTVTKSFRFEAAHSLPHLPPEHKCSQLHGHSYEFVVHCSGKMDVNGWVIDYGEISKAVAPLLTRLDHNNLNDILPGITTAENLAKWIFDELRLNGLDAIEVRETPTSNVIYRP